MKTLLTAILIFASFVCLSQVKVHEFTKFQEESTKGIKYSIWIIDIAEPTEIKVKIVDGREILKTTATNVEVYPKDKGMEYHYNTPEGLLVLYFDGSKCKTAWWLTDFETSSMKYKNTMKFTR